MAYELQPQILPSSPTECDIIFGRSLMSIAGHVLWNWRWEWMSSKKKCLPFSKSKQILTFFGSLKKKSFSQKIVFFGGKKSFFSCAYVKTSHIQKQEKLIDIFVKRAISEWAWRKHREELHPVFDGNFVFWMLRQIVHFLVFTMHFAVCNVICDDPCKIVGNI